MSNSTISLSVVYSHGPGGASGLTAGVGAGIFVGGITEVGAFCGYLLNPGGLADGAHATVRFEACPGSPGLPEEEWINLSGDLRLTLGTSEPLCKQARPELPIHRTRIVSIDAGLEFRSCIPLVQSDKSRVAAGRVPGETVATRGW